MRIAAFVLSFTALVLLCAHRASANGCHVPCTESYSGECASWYGPGMWGNTMSNMEVLYTSTKGVAHQNRPLGQVLEVTNLCNGKKTVVEVTDCGPFPEKHRNEKPIRWDLTEAAAKELGMIDQGVVPIKVKTLYTPRKSRPACAKS